MNYYIRKHFFLFLLCLIAGVGKTLAQKDIDYKVNIIKKIAAELTYPNVMQKSETFVIGLIGDYTATEDFSKSIGNSSIRGKRIEVKQITSASDINNQLFPIIYRTENTSLSFAAVARAISSKPMILITEQTGLAEKGSDFNLVKIEGKVWRYEINPDKIVSKGIRPPDALVQRAIRNVGTIKNIEDVNIKPEPPKIVEKIVYKEDETKTKEWEEKYRKSQEEKKKLETATESQERAILKGSQSALELKSKLDTMTNIVQIRNLALEQADKANKAEIDRIHAETESKRKEDEAKQQQQIANTRIFMLALVGIILLVSTIALLTFIASRRRKKIIDQLEVAKNSLAQSNQALDSQNQQLEFQKKEIEEQKNALVESNQKITDSIRYAQTIQNAMLPSKQELAEMFKSHFVIYIPKDIVSGDFYWASKREEGTFIAVADCTGHGVPGAFLSTVGNDILNELIIDQRIIEPNEILSHLHTGIFERLKQGESQNKDGMDICLCRIIEKEDDYCEITFAGAKRPVFYSQDGVIDQVKGDSKYLGGIQEEAPTFTNHVITLRKGERLYLTSDGYPDTPNKEKRKFGTTKFIELMQEVHKKDLATQYEIFMKRWEDHKGLAEIRDDTTIIAVEL
jgi:serine phosphatase RsbU (regulator of sigma subunit)